MGHAVGFQKAQPVFVPDFALDRHLVAQQRAGPRTAQTVRLNFERSQPPVEGGRADGRQQFLLAGQQLAVVALVVGQPQRQRRRQPFATQLLGFFPDRGQDRRQGFVLRCGTRQGRPPSRAAKFRPGV